MDLAPKPPATAGFTFPRDARLKKRADFRRVYEKGRKAHGKFVMAFALRRSDGEAVAKDLQTSRLGITVTRRVGGAVVRNRHRRLVREYFRLNRARIAAGWDIVINTKEGLGRGNLKDLSVDLDRTLARLDLLCASSNGS